MKNTTAPEQLAAPEPPAGSSSPSAESTEPPLSEYGFPERPSAGGISDAELLAQSCHQTTRPQLARAAWEHLYRRHARYVFVVVRNAFNNDIHEPDEITGLVDDVFRVACQWAARQQDPATIRSKFHDSDPTAITRRVQGWLSVIARRLATEHRKRTQAQRREIHLSNSLAAPDTQDDAEPPPINPASAVHDALAALQPGLRLALELSLPWYDPSRQQFDVPRGEATRIASQLGITPNALRQRRHRSLKCLRNSLRALTGE